MEFLVCLFSGDLLWCPTSANGNRNGAECTVEKRQGRRRNVTGYDESKRINEKNRIDEKRELNLRAK